MSYIADRSTWGVIVAFCGNCGANVADGATTCPSCGRPVAGAGTGGMTFAGATSGTSAPMGAPTQLADWGQRAVGWLIDFVILLAGYIIGFVFALAKVPLLAILFYLAMAAVAIWFSVQVGQTGQSPGMRVAGIKAIGKQTGEPIGGAMGFVRSICHFVDSLICYIGWLFPLWDQDRQTIADKIVGTVVVTVPKQGFKLTP